MLSCVSATSEPYGWSYLPKSRVNALSLPPGFHEAKACFTFSRPYCASLPAYRRAPGPKRRLIVPPTGSGAYDAFTPTQLIANPWVTSNARN